MLYHKYRPHVFEDVIGQDHITKPIQSQLDANRENHAYLFAGPRGLGKTTVARIVARHLNCLADDGRPCLTCKNCEQSLQGDFPDFIEMNAASDRGINVIRELSQKTKFRPMVGRNKVYILDEVHQLTGPAFSAFLKTLEEPSDNIIFILCTTEMSKILDTITSRCQVHRFWPVPSEKLFQFVQRVATNESIEVSTEVLEMLVNESQGTPREALVNLEKVGMVDNISVDEAGRLLGYTDQVVLENLFGVIVDKDLARSLEIVNEMLLVNSVAVIRKDMVGYLRALLYKFTNIAPTFYRPVLGLERTIGLWGIRMMLETLSKHRLSWTKPIGATKTFSRLGQFDSLELELAFVEIIAELDKIEMDDF